MQIDFFTVMRLIVIRPYCVYIGGRCDVGVVVLPSFEFRFDIAIVMIISCRGDYTGRSMIIVTLVLPSLNRLSYVL